VQSLDTLLPANKLDRNSRGEAVSECNILLEDPASISCGLSEMKFSAYMALNAPATIKARRPLNTGYLARASEYLRSTKAARHRGRSRVVGSLGKYARPLQATPVGDSKFHLRGREKGLSIIFLVSLLGRKKVARGMILTGTG
jgi:hypothetical protein